MSYVVLARKYRPRSFDQMVGQDHVVRALSNALQQQRLHHAYLFTGTRGIGKTTVSRILAKSLNCIGPDGQGGITAQPCGQCGACVEIDNDRYLDYIELDAASNRGIAEARDLIERAAYKPSIGRFKVFMIDEAHQLTKDAFSALLKTLEEPPDYLKFVLATTDPDRMLPTVLSRCLQFNLRPMPPEVVQAHLQQVLQAEAVAADSASLRLLSRAARGSMRDALSLTDQAIAYGGGRIEEAGVRAMLGAVDQGHAAALLEALARRDGAALLARVEQLRSLGLSATGTLESLAVLLQQVAVEHAVPSVDAGANADPDADDARRLATQLAADETHLFYSIVVQGRSELGLMSDEYGALGMVLLRALAFASGDAPVARATEERPAPPPASLPSTNAPSLATPVLAPRASAQAAPRKPPAAAVGERASEPEPPPWLDVPPDDEPRDAPAAGSAALRATSPPTITVPAEPSPAAASCIETPLGGRWALLVARLDVSGAVSALVRELSLQAGLEFIDTDTVPPTWQLVVQRDSLRTDALRDKLRAAVQAELGEPCQLQLRPGVPTDSPARREAVRREQRQAKAEATIRSDPLVRELMSQ
ncbi:MAG: DNA polymerase III subunit gamma/tau, partial [Rubrivivax sp.]